MKNIVLCVKQVPDTTDIKWTKENNIMREGMLSIFNPMDLEALELALKLKKETNAKLTAISMGPNQAKQILEFTLSKGADEAFLLSDKFFAGADTLATGKTLSNAVKTLVPDFDLIVCGQYAIDGDTAQTGATIGSFLGIEHISYVVDAEYKNEKFYLTAEQEEGFMNLEAKLPVLICVSETKIKHSDPKIQDYIKAQQKEIKTIGMTELNLEKSEVGISGSPTYVSKVFKMEVNRTPKILESFNPNELINEIERMKNGTK